MGGRLLDVHARYRELIREEIGREIADAVREGSILRTGPIALRIAAAYGESGLEPQQIADEIARAGARAGVAVEISVPRGRPAPRRAGAAATAFARRRPLPTGPTHARGE